jgi:hypothetical protein
MSRAIPRPLQAVRASLVVLTVSVGTLLLGAQAGVAGSGVPYRDPQAVGSLGLCNHAGAAITHGSIGSTPFAWRVVSSQAAQAPYDAAGRTATLYAFQPRKGLQAAQWSGEELTAASRYTNPAHPMTAATNRDLSLKDFIEDYPVSWDGLVQLRMYLGAPNAPTDSASYAATDIQVTGTTWKVVQGASVACNSGKSVSIETILKPVSSPDAHPTATASHSATPPSSRPTSSSRPAAASAGASSDPSNAASQSVAASNHGHTAAIVAILIAIVAATGAVSLIARHRNASTSSGPSSSGHRTAPKGR